MKKFLAVIVAAVAVLSVSSQAEAKGAKAAREPNSSVEQKFCGKWIAGPENYEGNYELLKPSSLLGTVKDGKFNVRVLAKTEGGSYDVLKDVKAKECICVKGVRKGKNMESVSGVYECNGGAQREPKYNEEHEAEDEV